MIIDSHVHTIREDLLSSDYIFEPEEKQIEKIIFLHNKSCEALEKSKPLNILQSMRESNIDKSVIMGLPWVKNVNCQKDNDFIYNTILKYPDKFIGYGVIQPLETNQAIKEIIRCKSMGFKGIKIIPNWQHYSLDDFEIMDPVMKVIIDNDMILLPHIEHPYRFSRGDMPYNLFNLVKRFPEAKIIASHLGGMLFMYYLYNHTKKYLDNMYFDMAVSASMSMVKIASEIIPENNLLFGTDYPFNSCHSQKIMLDDLFSYNINEHLLEKYLSKNFQVLIEE